MAKAIADIEDDIRELNAEDKARLLRDLIAEMNAPTDPKVAPSEPESGFGIVKLKSRGKPRRLSDFDAVVRTA